MTSGRDETLCHACQASITGEATACPQCGATLIPDSLTPTRAHLAVAQAELREPPGKPGAASPAGSAPDCPEYGFAPGTLFAGRLRIVSLLGRGGMRMVYRADDLKLGQAVALKFLPPTLRDDPAHLAALVAEVRNARQVSHPNVCRVYDIGDHEGLHYLSMEMVDGEDLASLLRRIGRLPAGKALEVAHQLCAGLEAAHDRGVIHRDLKPANVMIDGRGHARITDFGLSVRPAEGSRAGEVAGTPLYMAPEQLAGGGGSVKSDLYSLGLVLYEVVTGKRVFDAPTTSELRHLHASKPPLPPSRLVADLDPAVERAILRCLEKNAAARPRSAAELAALLPGGDPLAAALAAGQTPSPEMVVAQRNLRHGRGDLRGTLRLSVLVFAVGVGENLLRAHFAWASSMDLFYWIRTNGASALWGTVLLGLLYLALEPYPRRHYSHMLVGWSRVLAGRVRDPQVGRELLIGALAGLTLATLTFLVSVGATRFFDVGTPAVVERLSSLLGLRYQLGLVVGLAGFALAGTVILTATLALGRVILRRRWLAVTLVGVEILVVNLRQQADWVPTAVALVIAAAGMLVGLGVLMRCGILCFWTAGISEFLFLRLPLPLDLSAWYAGASLLGVSLVLGIALFGFHTSLGGRPIFGGAILKDE
ncbi:MAG: serine/threonine-protein kinase [Acidobacteriota bacterium]